MPSTVSMGLRFLSEELRMLNGSASVEQLTDAARAMLRSVALQSSLNADMVSGVSLPDFKGVYVIHHGEPEPKPPAEKVLIIHGHSRDVLVTFDEDRWSTKALYRKNQQQIVGPSGKLL